MPPKLGITEGIVLNYVNEQNRPLNSQCVADALQIHGIKKASVQKILDALADNAQISFKEYGKQKIFLAKQDQFAIPNGEELDLMRKENDQLQRETAAVKSSVSEEESELRSVQNNITDSQIREEVKKLTNEIYVMESKLTNLREGTVLITPEEKKRVEAAYHHKISAWRKRKRIFKDLWDMITETMPNDPVEFKEELGVELDDDVGENLEDYCYLLAVAKRPIAKRLKR